MNYVITIGRQFGSGGHEIGFRLAQKLGIPFYDKKLLTLTAENSRFSESFLEKMDETRPGFLSIGTGALSVSGETPLGQSYGMSHNDQVFIETSKTMQDLAKKGPCVIVGRCADYVLRDIPTIDLFITADLEDRISRKLALDKKEKLGHDAMEKKILSTDKARSRYYEYYSHERWGDASHYHLCINTSRIGVDRAVDLIERFVLDFGKKDILPD